MSLNANVLPGVVGVVAKLVDNGTIAAADLGMPSSTPQSPYCAITMADFDAPSEAGSDLMQTNWTVDLTLLEDLSGGQSNAEIRLTELVAPFRAIFNANVKMGQQTVARARIVGGSWGYMQINNVEYRSLVLRLSVVEKESQTYGA